MIDEHEILSGVNDKNAKAWKNLYAHFYAALCVYTNRFLRNEEASRDLVQEVFVAVWKGARRFATIQDLTRYLYRACYNNALVHIRNSRIHGTILQSLGKEGEMTDDDVFALTIREEVVRQLYVHINALPAEQKKVILLSIDGYSWDEIAEKLGVSVNTVKTHKSRGFRVLRSKLQDSVCIFLL